MYWVMRVVRPLGVILGLALAYYFLRSAGIERTLSIVRSAGVWLPVLVLLQIVIVLVDVLALRTLIEDTKPASSDERIATGTWFRASAVAYICNVLLPAGRAAGEALRATALAKTVGASRAAGAGARLQACSLLGSATTCFVSAIVIAASFGSGSDAAGRAGRSLAGLLALNGTICLVGGGAVFVLVRSTRLRAWLRKVAARVIKEPAGEGPSTRASIKAYLYCVLGRTTQTLQYGVGLLAVGGHFTLTSASTSQGVQLLGSTVGDLMPGQLGAMEGSYSVFSTVLGVSDAQSLSLVWIMRGATIGLALTGMLAAAILPAAKTAPSQQTKP